MSKVFLVGAGPGDPGLLTIKAQKVIQTCDVMIYDYLANTAFLNWCKPGAEILYVGKKGGEHTLPQEAINDLIIAKAGEGKTICRLKGGDPYVFGRGGEEAEELVEAGIDFEVIPGITAGVAAPAYAGIPVTHREHTTSVCFITGHEDPTKEKSGHNWDVYAQSESTLVFYMGVKNLPMIAENLMQKGRPKDTPVALVRWGTRCEQESFVSTLEHVAEEAARRGFKAPSIIIVGTVCSLKEKLGWFEKRPLLGRGVVITRAREQASQLVEVIEELGGCCYEFPTIQIQSLKDDQPILEELQRLDQYAWVVFTSVNGVTYFWSYLRRLGLDSRALGGRKVAAIGPATAAALEEKGIVPDFVPPKYVAESVVQGMLELGVEGSKVLIPRALKAREVLPRELGTAGADVTVLPVYETRLADADRDLVLSGLNEGKIHVVTFTSSSTVENFFELISVDMIREAVNKGLKLACIGPITGKTLESFGFQPQIMPDEYTIPGLVDALVDTFKEYS